MAIVSLSPLAGAGWQFLDDNANPLTGGLLYTYEAGTTTPLTTYTSSAAITANANPIVLDAAGRVSEQTWLISNRLYKFVLKTSAGVTVWTQDNVSAIPEASASAIPVSGTWATGDIVWNSAPTAGGFAGWICVSGGTPGTWKTFGAISA